MKIEYNRAIYLNSFFLFKVEISQNEKYKADVIETIPNLSFKNHTFWFVFENNSDISSKFMIL